MFWFGGKKEKERRQIRRRSPETEGRRRSFDSLKPEHDLAHVWEEEG